MNARLSLQRDQTIDRVANGRPRNVLEVIVPFVIRNVAQRELICIGRPLRMHVIHGGLITALGVLFEEHGTDGKDIHLQEVGRGCNMALKGVRLCNESGEVARQPCVGAEAAPPCYSCVRRMKNLIVCKMEGQSGIPIDTVVQEQNHHAQEHVS